MDDGGVPRPDPVWWRGRRKAVGSVVAFALAIGFGVALFSGHFPGLPGQIPTGVTLDGHQYSADTYYLGIPAIGSNRTLPSSVAVGNITFWVWTTGWYTWNGTWLHGNGTEPNGTTYSFVLGGTPSNPGRPTTFIAPGAAFAVTWGGGLFAQLLVEIPSR